MARSMQVLLSQGLGELSLDVAQDVLEERLLQLLQLHALLLKWAASINLTSIHDPMAIITRHFLDSLAVLPYINGGKVLDLGTGAGFPGLPLAIFSPEKRFVLLDGNQKKIAFIRHAVMDLGLSNVEAIARHSEVYRPDEKFGTVVARAVGAFPLLQEAAGPLLKNNGKLLCMKGQATENDIECLPSFRFDTIIPLAVPGLMEKRCLVQFSYQTETT